MPLTWFFPRANSFVVMDAMMTKAAGHKAIVGFPAIGVNVALRKDISSENWHQLLPRALPDLLVCEVQAGNLSAHPSPSLSCDPWRSKVAFILDVPSKRLHRRECYFHH